MRRTIGWFCSWAAVFVAFAFQTGTAHADFVAYEGDFSEIQTDGPACDGVFAVTSYSSKHFLSGPTHRTSVLHFNEAGEGAFFARQTFVGLYGPNGDVDYNKTVTTAAGRFEIHAEGLIDYEFVLLDVSVKGTAADGTLCRASASYSGFSAR